MSCSICLNNELELDYITPCNHRFHRKCINVWFESLEHRDKTCPQCRHVIETPTIIIIETENSQPIGPPVQNRRCICIAALVLDIFFLYFYHQYKNNDPSSHQLLLMFIVGNIFVGCLFRFRILQC